MTRANRLPSGGIHIKGVYSIWLAGLPAFAGWVLPYDRPIILALEGQYHPEKAVHYMIRIGYDRIHGYLKGSIESWYNAGFPHGEYALALGTPVKKHARPT